MLTIYMCIAVATAANVGRQKEQVEAMISADAFQHIQASASTLALMRRQPRSASNCLPSGFRSATVRNEGKPFNMAVLADADIVSDNVVRTGLWEVTGVKQMASRASVDLPASGTFLDIGANLGYYSLLFAKKGYHVIAVEPSSHNRKAISASLCMNPDIANLVKILPTALTDEHEVGNTRCTLRTTNATINVGNMFLKCGSTGAVKPCGKNEAACEEVPVNTLDSLLSELKPSSIDAVKIDIEGHECQVLQGGYSLFSKYAPKLVQVETNVGDSLSCVENASAKFVYKTVKLSSGSDSAMIPMPKAVQPKSGRATLLLNAAQWITR